MQSVLGEIQMEKGQIIWIHMTTTVTRVIHENHFHGWREERMVNVKTWIGEDKQMREIPPKFQAKVHRLGNQKRTGKNPEVPLSRATQCDSTEAIHMAYSPLGLCICCVPRSGKLSREQ